MSTKQRLGKSEDPELTAAEWEAVVADFKSLIFEETGQRFPEDPHEQLERAIRAVFDSWHGPPRRRLPQLPSPAP